LASEPIRYPDPRVKILDPRFAPLVLGDASIETLATGCRFTEGPVWFGDLRCLLWSDIPNDRIMKWEEETGRVSLFRRPSHYANGNTRDRQGRLITCEMDTQRLTRTEYDGTITVLADSFDGKKLTGPNDVVVKSDGSIWFSDNGAGIRVNYLGHKATAELPYRVYRIDGRTGQITVAVGDMERPNGLAFSPDEMRLYVVDTPGARRRRMSTMLSTTARRSPTAASFSMRRRAMPTASAAIPKAMSGPVSRAARTKMASPSSPPTAS